MRILVTGGAGFIGHRLTLALRQAGHEATAVDSLWCNGQGGAKVVRDAYRQRIKAITQANPSLTSPAFVRLDLRRPRELNALLVALDPQAVVHLAGLSSTAQARSPRTPAWRHIIAPTATLLHCLAQQPGRPLLVYVSSSMV